MADPADRETRHPAFDEVRIFIDPDGTVTICDLWEGLLPVAEALGDVTPVCPMPARTEGDGPKNG